MDLNQIPKDDELLWTAFRMYKTTDLSPVLKTEKNRTVFAENFESAQAQPLSTLCLNVIASNYKGRPITLELSPIQTRIFYDCLPELPIEKCVHISDELYWKRMYTLKCKSQMQLKQKCMQKDVCWKDLVITIKLVELIENTMPETWAVEKMENIARLVAPYVRVLRISKLQAKREDTFLKSMMPSESFLGEAEPEEEVAPAAEGEEQNGPTEETDALNPFDGSSSEEEEEVQTKPTKPMFPIEECHHGDLSLVRFLTQMTSLTVEFLPPELSINYHSRYFDFSYVDMQNLAKGISELGNLKVFNIRRSRMDSCKLSIILEAIKMITLEHVEFYFCQLDDECGESLYEYLVVTSCLKHLDLSGNYLREVALDYISAGIKQTPSKLEYLGLSNNPIPESNLCDLVDILIKCDSLTHLTLSGINVTTTGAKCIAKLIKEHTGLEEMEIIAVPIHADSLIEGMNENKKIQHLLCQGCGLTIEEEFKMELLLKRNRHIKANPYIGDPTKTEEEIVAFVSRVKNPILLKAMAIKESRDECLKKRAERDKSPPEDDGEQRFKYKSKQFTEEELDQRVTLFSQNSTNFFKKKAHK